MKTQRGLLGYYKMIDEELDRETRQIQIKYRVVVDMGDYTISRPLSYQEALKIAQDRRNKGTLNQYLGGENGN